MNGSIYNYLVVFHAIVNEGSLAAAARQLETAPPAVSKSLKLLEQTIGLPLFNRTTRHLELTEAGQHLFQNTQEPIKALTIALESVQDLKSEPAGIVRITTARYAYLSVLQPYLGEFYQRYPRIQLEIAINDGTVNLSKEGYDLGIRFGNKIEEHVVARQILTKQTQGLFASKHYLEQHGVPQNPVDLKQHQLIGYRFTTANTLSPLLLQEDGKEISVEMPVSFVANDIEVNMDAIRQGIGIGRIFLINLKQQPDQENFIPVLKPYWRTFPPVYLYYLQNSQKSKRVRTLIDFLLEKNTA